MNRLVHAAVAVAAFVAAASVTASPIAWRLSGVIEQISDPSNQIPPPGFKIGDTFSLVMWFDNATPLATPGNPGGGQNTNQCLPNNGLPASTCRFTGDTSMRYTNLQLGALLIPVFPDPGEIRTQSIIVRNNVADPDIGDTVDGYSFSIQRYDAIAPGFESTSMGVIFRGPDLGIVTNAKILPSDPPPGLTALRSSQFNVCVGILNANLANNCEIVGVVGRINSVTRVPEPGTIALLGGALLGLAGLRRARTSA